MELKHARGNTYYLEDWQLIPLYLTDKHHCILLDTGLWEQRQEIEDILAANDLTPIGILGSHSHNDHSSNHHYFQQKYHIPVALPMAEAGLCCSYESLKSHFYMDSMREFVTCEPMSHMLVRADRIIFPEERELKFCGVSFGVLPTPGHALAHTSYLTPDGVLYLADAILTGAELRSARFPYHFDFLTAMQTLENLKTAKADLFLAAHRGVYDDLGDLPERNIQLIQSRMDIFKGLLVEQPLNISELAMKACERFRLYSSSHPGVALYERNVRAHLDYLKDTEQVTVTAKNGIFYYQAK